MEIIDVVHRLWGKNGCPWNASQKPQQLLSSLIAETTELKSAIDSGAIWEITEEIGDVLFNVVSLIEYYQTNKLTDLVSIDQHISNKMRSRHPYVFEQMPDPGPNLATSLWENAKRIEAERLINSRAGVSFGYLLYYDTQSELFMNQEWLRSQTLNLLAQLDITPKLIDFDHPPNQKISHCITIYGETIDFLLVRVIPQCCLVVIHGISTGRFESQNVYVEVKSLFSPERIESIAYPLGSAQIDSFTETE